MVVAIDGPAGSGKGTITKVVGKRLGLVYIDTGAMYRCASLYMLRNDIGLDEFEKIAEMLDNIDVKQVKDDGDVDRFYLNGEDVSDKIRSKEVNEIVSQVSHIVIVREKMVELQREMGKSADIIMEGRDIGTNVFPDAEVKIYLDASAEERANRRMKQNEEKGIVMGYDEVLANIKFRDNNDKTSSVAPLKQAEDAVYVDTTDLNIDEVVDKIERIILSKR